MKLTELIRNLNYSKIYNFRDLHIKGISCDSRRIKEDFIFLAIKGESKDGFSFVPQAIKRGAKVVVGENDPQGLIPSHIVYIQVKNIRQVYSHLCAEFYKNPSYGMKVIGVTGTNGKTTVIYLIEKILRTIEEESLLIGTIDYHYRDKIFPSHNTTPSCEDIQLLLAKAKKEKVTYAIMEVSSHSLSQSRVDDVRFSYAIFTNLSQDHLDYHRSLSAYFNAKTKLFKMLNPKDTAIVNIDDPYGRKILKKIDSRILTYGLNRKADIYATEIKTDIEGTRFTLISPKGDLELKSPLLGTYNVYNLLAGCAFAILENIELSDIKKAVEEFQAPKGRLELVYRKDFFVFVDYAHTPIALKSVLSVLREVFKKRIILVFGCGGQRDRDKRPQMGRIATELADQVIITSDNPRNEEPLRIIEDILKGIKKKNYFIYPNRKKAIFKALSLAKASDVVLVAGKGHERYQIIQDRIIPFDDRQVIKQYFKN